MKQKLQTLKDSLSTWAVRHTEGKNARWWLFGMSFAESSFFPVPPDVLLVAILMTKERARAFYYATITTAGSVLGGLLGYAIGYFLFQTVGVWLVDIYHLETEMITVQKLFANNAFFAIFVAAFTPIPYKVFTIAGGLFGISVPTLIIASILGRGGRFFAVATVMKYFGGHIARVFYEYFNLISFAVVIVLGVILYSFFL
ncbi:MAG: cytochrome B [Candidatus Yonathbacteria bacterium CG17_big_fil_post_rev_8_21_14_2_50_43_9]|nr:MAG: cytochrome B [Candidatus Yonathbacteria bacterium CG17_big_fil_post_rev_8_21_14_2_50_43_9]PIX57562.1 MAG: cytochrome B [Candidatus Yonathbacteria bacterium CG_4_10_14_3_um_filter_43_12]